MIYYFSTGARLGPMEETVAQPPPDQAEPDAPRRPQRKGPQQETSMGVTPGAEPPQQKERRKRKVRLAFGHI